MPSLSSASMALNAKVAAVILPLTTAILLLLYKAYHHLIHSSNYNTCLLLLFHFLFFSVLLIYHNSSNNTDQTAPLFSFPSLSQPLFSVSSLSVSSPLFSFSSLSRKPRLDTPTPGIIFDDKEPIFISPSPQAANVLLENDKTLQQKRTSVKLGLEPQDEVDESMDDTWNAILARGGAKPVKLTRTERFERTRYGTVDQKKEMKKLQARKKKEELKVKEREEGWRQRDELVRRVETFIRKHYETSQASKAGLRPVPPFREARPW